MAIEPRMDGEINRPKDAAQKRENVAYARAQRFARKHYPSSEARIVEMVDKSMASDSDEQRATPPATLWHALIVLADGSHAVVGVRDETIAQGKADANDAQRDAAHDDWSAFEVNPPTLGDIART